MQRFLFPVSSVKITLQILLLGTALSPVVSYTPQKDGRQTEEGDGGTHMIRAVIFDLDGTLVETEELKALSYARAAVELRPELNEAEVFEALADGN